MPFVAVMLGDVVGTPGVLALEQLMPEIRSRYRPDLVIADAENAADGSGLTPPLYNRLRQAGIDGLTLGDHCYKRMQISRVLESDDRLIRPCNLPESAKGRGWMRLPLPSHVPPTTRGYETAGLYVVTLLGRVFMTMNGDDPFACLERTLVRLPEPEPMVLVEIHAEATAEKQAMGRFADGRAVAVVGTHTHVPTADTQIYPGGTAYQSDLGMCGPVESILGRRIDRVLTHMTTAMPAPFDVAAGEPRVQGIAMEIDERQRRATRVERIDLAADPTAPPFQHG